MGRLLLLVLVLIGVASCASTPEERGPWQQWLHEHKWE
jgi:hypothetical protein